MFSQTIKNTSLLLIIFTSLITTTSAQNSPKNNEYLKSLHEHESSGGSLYCKNESGGTRQNFNSCESFQSLLNKGCFDYSTAGIKMKAGYSKLCEDLKVLNTANPVSTIFFNFNFDYWWKDLPAEIIPMSGGVYSDDSWEIAKIQREQLVKGKTLGEITFEKVYVTKDAFEAIISVNEDDCGGIRDYFKFSINYIADFNNDEIADLLITGVRLNQSDSCGLGSGNSLGSSFSVLVQKKSEESKVEVINQK